VVGIRADAVAVALQRGKTRRPASAAHRVVTVSSWQCAFGTVSTI
jgi:hypothetical protein